MARGAWAERGSSWVEQGRERNKTQPRDKSDGAVRKGIGGAGRDGEARGGVISLLLSLATNRPQEARPPNHSRKPGLVPPRRVAALRVLSSRHDSAVRRAVDESHHSTTLLRTTAESWTPRNTGFRVHAPTASGRPRNAEC